MSKHTFTEKPHYGGVWVAALVYLLSALNVEGGE